MADSTTPNARIGNRFALIEAVRGLAALLVVYSHTMPKEGWFFTYIFDPGKIGVVVFFFISGYLVIPSAARDGSASRFLLKRFFRLYPLYWISLMFAYLAWPEELSALDWMANISMAQQLFGFENAIDVYWTLTIEVVLYVVITAFLISRPALLTSRFGVILGCLGCACLAAAALRWGMQAKIPVAVPLGLFCMFTGAQMRFRDDQGEGLISPVLLYLAVTVPTCWIAYSFSVAFDETSSRYIVTYVTGGLIFYAILKKPHLDLGYGMRALGDWSFGIYLFHLVIAIVLMAWFEKGLFLFASTLILSIAISAPLFRFIEMPAVRFGRRLLPDKAVL